MFRRHGMGLRALVSAAVVLAGLAAAPSLAQVLLQPVVLELSPRQRSAMLVVTLSDRAAAPVRLQAQALRWEQDREGRSLTQATDDLLVSPPIADLRPGQRQVFRVALRNPHPLPQEAAYRLVLEDVAAAPVDESGQPLVGLNIRMRYDLPLMVGAAAKPVSMVRWKPCPPEPSLAEAPKQGVAEACVRLRNAGTRRIRVQALQLAGDGWQQSFAIKEGATVLAGAEREWRVPLPDAGPGPLRDVQVQTTRGDNPPSQPGGF
jgi:fimbrial chaperone protein